MVKDIHFIGLCLGMCLGIILAQGIGVQPDHRSRYSVSTVISTMSSELSSVHGNCSFPPTDVLTKASSRPSVDSYDFLEMCDRKIPSLDKPVLDGDVIMCLGLLELGLRLCSLESIYFKNDQLFALPSDAHSFNSLIAVLNQQDDSDLCTNLKKVLDVLDERNFPEGILKMWSLQKVFHESEKSCSRICFDYTGKPQLLCKLILWGSYVLIQPEPKAFQSVISNSAKGNGSVGLSNNSLAVLGQTAKSGYGTSTNQGSHIEQVNQDDVGLSLHGLGEVKPSDDLVGPSSSPEVNPVAQVMPILNPADDKSFENLNKADPKQNITKLVPLPNGQSETPIAMVSMEGMRNVDSVAGPSTIGPSQEVIINEKSQKTVTKPFDAASIVDTGNTKSKDNIVGLDEKSAISPAEKMPTDMILRGDDFRDHYDSSLDQNQDDDDVNFPPIEQEQPAVSHETTGYKADYKYSQDETNANTFLKEPFEDPEDSHFFSYFMAMVVLCIVGYVVFHNKQKILALALEGRSKRTSRRRPATANYHKLDNNLEEAVSSPCNTSVTHVIY